MFACLVDGICCAEELAVVLIYKGLHIAVQLSDISNELVVGLNQSWQLLLHKHLVHVLVYFERMAVYRKKGIREGLLAT